MGREESRGVLPPGRRIPEAGAVHPSFVTLTAYGTMCGSGVPGVGGSCTRAVQLRRSVTVSRWSDDEPTDLPDSTSPDGEGDEGGTEDDRASSSREDRVRSG